MEINGLGHIDGPQSIRPPHRSESVEQNHQTDILSTSDSIDISPEAEMLSKVADVPDIRADRVAEIKSQIEMGTYETDENLELAVGRLLDEIG